MTCLDVISEMDLDVILLFLVHKFLNVFAPMQNFIVESVRSCGKTPFKAIADKGSQEFNQNDSYLNETQLRII